MPATKPEGSRAPRSRSTPDALERLWVYWLISTGLLMLAVLIVAIMTRGTLQRQNVVVSELADRVTVLQDQVRELQESAGVPRAGGVPATTEPREREDSGVKEPAGALVPGGAPRVASRGPAPAATPVTPVPSDGVMRTRLEEVVADDPVTLADVTDVPTAGHLLELALRAGNRAPWSGRTWSRLAVLARLLAQDVLAEDFAERAAAAGESLSGYTEVSVRSLLARGRAREALPLARELMEPGAGRATARVLAAATFLETDDPASADEVLEALPVPVVVPSYDKLVLARVLLALEHWPRLEAVLSTLPPVPEKLMPEYSFLLAASLGHGGQTVKALAILDGLQADETATTEAASPEDRVWPWPRPDRYQIEVWRGVTLTLAQQPETARQVLQQAAELDPGRPDAQYYLGVLEARLGRPDVAKMYLKNALASAARLVPAWEALASLEINEGEINLALQHLSQAVSINFRRALAHFLMAIAHAKVLQKGPAAEALRITFQLEGSYLAEAKQTEVLLNLFTPAELDELAAEPAAGALRPEPPEEVARGQP